jgi:AspT/YidE/YbjL antiporter-like protein
LGGIAGTLLVGVVIGQLGVNIDAGIKGIFFALFIYAVGFQGGPQFFHALNRRSLSQLASAFVMCFTGLLCVLGAAWLFGLDRGMAAGLAAGGLTQSAIIGTAGDAIGKLGLSAASTKTMQTNVAVGYAVCYIFGSLGPIIMVSWFLPAMGPRGRGVLDPPLSLGMTTEVGTTTSTSNSTKMGSGRATSTAVIARLDRATQYSKAAAMGPRGRGVLAFAGDDDRSWTDLPDGLFLSTPLRKNISLSKLGRRSS